MEGKLADGETNKRLMQDEMAMQNYVKNKEISDKLDEERRIKNLKDKEHEMKRILDI